MSCSICGRGAMPGAKLCAQCKAALKRARHETVSQLEPLRRGTSGASGRRTPRPDRAANERRRNGPAGSSLRSFPRRLRLPAMVVALGVAIVVAGYFGTPWQSAGAAHDESSLTGAPSSPPAQQVVATVEPVADRTSQSASPVEASPATPPQPKPTATRGPAKAASARPEPAPPAIAFADFESAIEPRAPPTTPEPPPVRETPPDRWQLLADALVKCESETFLANVVCVQRARWQYCDGHWGKVPQCPAMNSSYER